MKSLSVLLLSTLLVPLLAVAAPQKKVLIVSAEMKGAFQTGGLGHATTDLAASLAQHGYDVEVTLPMFLKMNDTGAVQTDQHYEAPIDWFAGHSHRSARFSLWQANIHGVKTSLFHHDEPAGHENYFDNRRDGKYPTYSSTMDGEGFAALARAEADHILRTKPDLVILNDWTAGLVALFLRDAQDRGAEVPKIVFALHNIKHQGIFSPELSKWMGIDAKHWNIDGIAHDGQWSMLKAGLMYSDMVYTVSPTYALEIKDPRSGMGMDGVIRLLESRNRMTGILNGIVNEEWDPRLKKSGLDFTFDENDFSGKANGKAGIQREMNLPEKAETPLFVLTSRLDDQKGFAYLVPAIENALQYHDVQFIISGDGDIHTADQLRNLQARFPEKLRFLPFSAPLEKKLMRYGDFFVNGAWFEPCGLNQFFALRNATIPLVADVGGLKDSVHEGVNGLKFGVVAGHNAPYSVDASRENAIHMFWRAIQLFHNKTELKAMRTRAISEDHSWSKRLNRYYNVLFDYVTTEGWNKGPVSYATAEPTVKVDLRIVPRTPDTSSKPKEQRMTPKPRVLSAREARMCKALFQ